MLNLQQRQSLQQKLSPQQIQYIKLLQLPTLALEQRIKAELELNPLLEEGMDEELEERNDDAEDTEISSDSEVSASETETVEEPADRDDDYNWEEFIDSSDDLYGYKARVDNSDEEELRDLPMPANVSMTEHLREQLLFLDSFFYLLEYKNVSYSGFVYCHFFWD